MSLVEPGDPILREKMPEFAGDLRTLRPAAQILWVEMRITREGGLTGIGMAAPMCGQRLRMFVMNAASDVKRRSWGSTYVCINPVVLERRGDEQWGRETSLLRPGASFKIARHEEIRVEFTDLLGKRQRETLHGLVARCFQHQLDQLDGIAPWDRAE